MNIIYKSGTFLLVATIAGFMSNAASAASHAPITAIRCMPSASQQIANSLFNAQGAESVLTQLIIRLSKPLSMDPTLIDSTGYPDVIANLEVTGRVKSTGRFWDENAQGKLQMTHWPAGLDLYGGRFVQNSTNYFAFGNYAVEIDFPESNDVNNVGKLYFEENQGHPEGSVVPFVEISCMRK